jgi:hypothetical protein
VDIDSQQKRVYEYAKQGAAFGHTKIGGKSLLVRGLNVLAASICTPLAAPVIAATRLRGRERRPRPRRRLDDQRSRQHRPRCRVHRHAGGADGLGVLRLPGRAGRLQGGSIFLRHRADGSQGPCAIAVIGEHAWTPIRYPHAIWDEQLGCWVSAPRSPR